MSLHSSLAGTDPVVPVLTQSAPRGYALVYHSAGVNHCPGCGQSQWYVGRSTAQCAFCETALPLERSFLRTGLSAA